MTEITISWRKLQFHDASYNFMTEITISWRKLQFHDASYNFMTQITISWRKLQFHDANHNFMTQITISWRKLLFHDGHERNDRQTHHCDTGRQVDLPGNLDPTCVELCMCVGWVQVTTPISVSIQMIVQRAADNQPSGWCGKRSADIKTALSQPTMGMVAQW